MTKPDQPLGDLTAATYVVGQYRITVAVMPSDQDRSPARRLERHQLVGDRGREISCFDSAACDYQSFDTARAKVGDRGELSLEVPMGGDEYHRPAGGFRHLYHTPYHPPSHTHIYIILPPLDLH